MIIIWNAIIAAFNAEEFNYSGVIVNLVLEDLLSGNKMFLFVVCVQLCGVIHGLIGTRELL